VENIVGFVDKRIWYRVHVSEPTVRRAQELAIGGMGPDWRVLPGQVQGAAQLTLTVETTGPGWFQELETAIMRSR
jgi:hypothetical protein